MKIKQRIPNSVDIGENEPPTADVNSLKELMDVPWVKQWTENKEFYRFSCSHEEGSHECHLMAELDEGYKWWVVAFMYAGTIPYDLPRWIAKNDGEQ